MALTRPKAAQVNFDSTNISDPLIRLNSGQSGSNTKDLGLVLDRGSDTNVAIIWDESENQFAVINTAEDGSTIGNITVDSYANIKAAAFYGDGSNLTGVTSYGDSDVASYLSANGYGTSSSIIASITDSAPGTLDTLNELAAALGDDPNFATTITSSIATKWTQDNTKISNWDTAYSWGDHSAQGYVTSIPSIDSIEVGDSSITVNDAGTGTIAFVVDSTDVFEVTSAGIMPKVDSDGTTGFDLGSSSLKWRDLYLSSGSLYIDGQKVVESDAGTIVVQADEDQSLTTKVTGTGVLTLSSASTININGTLQMATGKKITDVSGTAVVFGDKIDADSNQIINVGAPSSDNHAATKTYVDTSFSNLVNGAPVTLNTLDKIAQAINDDPSFSTAITTSIATKWTQDNTKITNWDTAYAWGNHSLAGYLTSETSHTDVLVDGDFTTSGIMSTNGSGTYSIITDNSSNWNTAFGWGNHASEGYITDYTVTQADVTTHQAALSITESQISDLGSYLVASDISSKANLASPTFTGTPAAPTAAAGTNTTQIATTQFVSNAVSNLVDTAPEALNTLNELAAALGDDANFSTTISTQIGAKLDSSSYTAADVLAKIKTVDGSGSGLDADLLDGQHGSYYYSPANAPDPTLTLNGDVSGSATFTNLGNATLTVTVANDSHTHVFGNITSTSLSSASDLDGHTTRALAHWGSSNPANSPAAYGAMFVIPDGSQPQQLVQTYGGAANKVSLYGRRKTGGTWDTVWTQYFSDHYHPNADKWTTARTLSLSGDASGNVTWDGSANATLSVTVADDSHNHTIANVDGLQTALDGKLSTSGKAADSNLLDGIDSGSFLRSDTNDTTSGTLTVQTLTVNSNTYTTTSDIALTANSVINAESSMNFGLTDGSSGKYSWRFGNTSKTGGTAGSTEKMKLTAAGALTVNGATAWTSGNDGSGSGLDADLLDGMQASSFLRSDVSDTFNGLLTVNTTNDYQLALTSTDSWTGIYFNDAGGNNDPIYHNGTNGTFAMGGGGSNVAGKKLHVHGGMSVGSGVSATSTPTNGIYSEGPISVGGSTVWNAGNDGSGSGLDADLLDGQHGSYYTGYTDTAIANLVDSSPATLDTLNELAAALNDDPNFATTVTTNIGTKVSKSGDTMSSDLIVSAIGANNNAAATDNIKVSGYGIVGNRATFYVTNNGTVQIGVGGTHNSNSAMTFGTNSNVSQKTLYENSNRVFTDGYHPNADKWTTARTLSLSGDASGSVSWDGSSNATLSVSVGDADTVDGLQGSQFLRSDADDTASGSYSFTNSYNEFGNSTGSVSNDGSWNARVNIAGSSHARLDVKSVSDGIITSMFSHTGHGAGKMGTYSNHPLELIVNGADKATLSTAGSLSTTAQGTLWGSSNDGSGSGLDADLLDGVQASSFLRSDADDVTSGQLTVNNASTYDTEGNLVVYGTGKNSVIIQASDNENDRGMAFRNSGGAYLSYINMENRGSNTADMVFGVNSATSTSIDSVAERMRITKEGNIVSAGGEFQGLATSSQYADLAEKYLADAEYPIGTVLEIGGDAEVTIANPDSYKIVGTVSEKPGLLMNSGLEGEHVVPVAYIGRVPCRVQGTIERGDFLVVGDTPGVAVAKHPRDILAGQAIGKALESHTSDEQGVIEILVGRF